MIIYTYKGCSTCKKAIKWLDTKGVSYEERAIRETPPSSEELYRMLEYQDGELRKLFNTAGGDYRELDMKTKLPEMSVPDAIELLSGRGNLVKRPFLLGEDFGFVGFKETEWAQKIG
ncbi:MAG: arsenate reductase family protein [Verrucomicrobiota bacterium]